MFLILFSVLIIVINSEEVDSSKPYLTKEKVEQAKMTSSFETYDYDDHPFKDKTLDQLKAMFSNKFDYEDNVLLRKPTPLGNLSGLPAYFNTREQWPNCNTVIKEQQQCGSCWAFAATSTLAERFCIQSEGKIKVNLSPQDMVSCDVGNGDNGCQGGHPEPSWQYLQYVGVPTESCVPYVSGSGYIPECPLWSFMCADRTKFKRYFAKRWNRFYSVEDAMKSIMHFGPIQTGYQIYEDFLAYKGGIYIQNSNVHVGGHMVKVVGWGNDVGTNYWICENSMGPNWGEKGLFRIRFGECLFENQFISGDPLFA